MVYDIVIVDAIRLLFVVFWTAVVVLVRRLVRGRRRAGWSYRHELLADVMRRESDRALTLLQAKRPLKGVVARLPRAIGRRIRRQATAIEGVPVEIVTPIDWEEEGPVILYLHGGGYVTCSPGTYAELVARLAVAARARCIVVDYRLAPAHAFPAAVDDCEKVYRALIARGLERRLFVAGDSAGGGLTLAVLLRAKAAGAGLPRAAMLISPWVDVEHEGGSMEQNSVYDYLQPAGVRFAAESYLQGQDPRHPEVSPVYADLSGLPPLLVHTGEAELFLDQNTMFVERARQAGTIVIHHMAPDMVHVWHLFASIIPEGSTAIVALGRFVHERMADAPITQALPAPPAPAAAAT